MGIILAFGNKARQGKDTASAAIFNHITHNNLVLDRHEQNKGKIAVRQFRFADALYDECRRFHGMTTKDAPLLQRVGAERRAENPFYWVDKVFDQIREFQTQNSKSVSLISDLRYKNEAQELAKREGYAVQVVALDSATGKQYIDPSRPADHISETDLDDYPWDFFIKAYRGDSMLVDSMAIAIYYHVKAINGL